MSGVEPTPLKRWAIFCRPCGTGDKRSLVLVFIAGSFSFQPLKKSDVRSTSVVFLDGDEGKSDWRTSIQPRLLQRRDYLNRRKADPQGGFNRSEQKERRRAIR